MKWCPLPFLLGLLFCGVSARADTAAVGDVQFNQLFPGINDFTVDNYTGSNNLGFFVAADNLVFGGIVLQLTEVGGAIDSCSITSLGPGTDTSCQFSSSTVFTQALFTATLTPTTFSLANGPTGTFVALPTLSLTLLPSSGATLVAGTDLGVIDATPATNVPEPGTWMLLATALAGTLLLRRLNAGCRHQA